MKWRAGTADSNTGKPYYYESDCGRYTVTIPTRRGEKYGSWHVLRNGAKERTGAELLGYLPSATEAKTKCEEHKSVTHP